MPGTMDGWVPVDQTASVPAAPQNDGWVSVAPQGTAPAATPQAQPNDGWVAAQPQAKPAVKPTADPKNDPVEPTLNFGHFKSKYAQELDAQAKRLNIDPKLLRAVHYVEDASEDPNIISDAGAIGEMQMKPGTFKQFAAKGASITDPIANIDAGAMALSYYMHKYGGNVDRAVSAYAQGEGFADAGSLDQDYLKKYRTIYNSLTKDIPGPGSPANPMTKGSPKPKAVVAAPTAAQIAATPHGTLTAGPSGVAGTLEYAGNAVEVALRKSLANIQDVMTLSDDQKAAIAKIGKLPAVEGVATGARIVGDLALLPFSGLDAVMRDVATGKMENIGDLGQRVSSALKDPTHAGDFLDQLTEKYGPYTRSENLWWAQQPGLREAFAKAKPKTSEGVQLQYALGLRADVGRYLLNKEFVSGGLGFITGMVAPVGPEMALVRGGARITTGVAKAVVLKPLVAAAKTVAPRTAVKTAARLVDFSAHVDAAKDKFLASAPIVGDRYYAVYKAFGDVGENQQRNYVKNQAETHYSAHQILAQENKLGGSRRKRRVDIHREADKFFNPHETLHVNQPQGGHPYFDPITGTTTMTKGPAWGPQVSARQVVYAQHPAPNLPGEPTGSPTIQQGKEAEQIFSGNPDLIKNYNKLIKAGDVRGAVRMLPGIAPQDVDAFVAQVESVIGKMAPATVKKPKPRVAPKLGNTAPETDLLSTASRQNGYAIAEQIADEHLTGKKPYADPLVAAGVRPDLRHLVPMSKNDFLKDFHRALVDQRGGDPNVTKYGLDRMDDLYGHYTEELRKHWNEAKNPQPTAKPSRAQLKLIRDLVGKKAVGHWLQSTGRDAAEIVTPHGTEVIMPRQVDPLERDERMVGNVSIHDRAINTAHVMHATDEASMALAPSVGAKMVEGYLPRAGMFAEESSLLERIEGPGASLDPAKGGGGGASAAPGQTQKREFGSIRHAESRGQQINSDFDPAAAIEGSMARSLKFQNYVRYALDAAEGTTRSSPVIFGKGSHNGVTAIDKGQIDYDVAVQAAIKSGRLPMPAKALTLGQLGKGPAGRKAFEKWVAEQATDTLANGPQKLTPAQLADTTDERILDVRKKAMAAIHDPIQSQFESDHPDLMWNTDQELGVEDLAGLTLPKVIKDAAVDGHPVLNQNAGQAPKGAWALRDAPEHWLMNGFETVMNGLRLTFLFNILYHPFRNLSRLAFGFGYLNPIDLAQGLFAPHTIDDALLHEAEEMGATARKFSIGAVGPKTSARYGYADPVRNAHTPKGIIGERGAPLGLGAVADAATGAGRSRLGTRIRTALDGYRNVISDSAHGPVPAVSVGMHVLGKAMYNAERWNTDWTFGVWEDALAAQTYGKLRDRGIKAGKPVAEAKAAAANEVRRIMGDTGNLTPAERALQLARMNWFYGWTKGQWRLWSRVMNDPRAAQFFTASTYSLRVGNEATSLPDPQNYPEDLVWGYEGDKPLALRIGGGFITKAEGIADLATAPLTAGQGLLDFAGATVNDAVNTLNPVMRLIFVNAGQTFGYPKGQEPSPWGTIMDRDLPLPMEAQQAAQQIGKRALPSEAETLKEAMKKRDPIYLMDMLGIRVKDMNEAQEARLHGIVEGRYRKVLEQSLRYATSNEQKEALKNIYGPLIKQEEDTRMGLQGY